MFSKALYKQSWKANWLQWLSVTLVSCFILTIIMSMAGGEGISSLTTSFTDTFVKDQLQSNFENTAINYHYVSNDSLESFDKAFLDQYIVEIKNSPFQAPSEESIANAYSFAIGEYQKDVAKRINSIDESFVVGTKPYEELFGVAMFTLNPNGAMDELYEQYEVGSTPTNYDIMSLIMSIDETDISNLWMSGNAPSDLYDVIRSLERIAYRYNRSRNSSSIFMAGNMSSEVAKKEILKTLTSFNITEKKYNTFGFDFKGLKNIATAAITTFQARLDFEISRLNRDDFADNEAYEARVKEIKIELQSSITATLMAKMPSLIAESMKDMEEQDMYTMTVGNMYFGTKRNTVTITQMIFL